MRGVSRMIILVPGYRLSDSRETVDPAVAQEAEPLPADVWGSKDIHARDVDARMPG